MILRVVASFSRIKTSRKGEGLGLALNQTKGRKNEVFWQNQNVDQLKKNFRDVKFANIWSLENELSCIHLI